MKLIEGLKLKGGRITIPDCSRDDLPELFVQLGYKVGAEIGVYLGKYTELFCKAGLKMYGIDPYLSYPSFVHPKGQKRMEEICEESKIRLIPYDYTLIRKSSMDALFNFEDESLDFVYIDGNHQFRYIAEDLFEWPKKVKRGGIISGHDYFTVRHPKWNACDVPQILHAYIDCFQIDTWFVLGSRRPKEGEKRDKYRSWLWRKE